MDNIWMNSCISQYHIYVAIVFLTNNPQPGVSIFFSFISFLRTHWEEQSPTIFATESGVVETFAWVEEKRTFCLLQP